MIVWYLAAPVLPTMLLICRTDMHSFFQEVTEAPPAEEKITVDDEEVEKETFFGVNEDVEYLADWINTFVTRINRWR